MRIFGDCITTSFLLILTGCTWNVKKDDSTNLINYDSKNELLIDSLKWIMYSINYDIEPVCQDRSSHITTNVVGLPIYLEKETHDSISVFRFAIEDTLSKCFVPLYFNGLIVIPNGQLIPISHSIKYDFQENLDSCRVFFEKRKKYFEEYLKSYNGKVDAWLINENKKRKITK